MPWRALFWGEDRKTGLIYPMDGAMVEKLVLHILWAGQWQKNFLCISYGRGNGRKTFYVYPMGGAMAEKLVLYVPWRGNGKKTILLCPGEPNWRGNGRKTSLPCPGGPLPRGNSKKISFIIENPIQFGYTRH